MKLLGGSIFHLKEFRLRKISQPNKQLGGWVGRWVGKGDNPKKKRESLLEDSSVHKSRGCKQVSRSDTKWGASKHKPKTKRNPMLLTS